MDDDHMRQIFENLNAGFARAQREIQAAERSQDAFETFLRTEIRAALDAGTTRGHVFTTLMRVTYEHMADDMPSDTNAAMAYIRSTIDSMQQDLLNFYMRRMARELAKGMVK